MSYLEVKTKENVAIIVFNQPGAKVNTLNTEMIDEFNSFLDKLENDSTLKGAVLISGKKDNFIAGADIEMFQKRETSQELEQLSKDGHKVLNRIEAFQKPVVVAIHGSCIGGGLELSMACHYRVISNHSKTVLGLPEVQLGILPGTGGTQRLPRIIGIQKALNYMLTGKNIYARQAYKMGLADEITHKDAIETAAIKAVHKLSANKNYKSKDKRSFTEKLLESTPIGRNIIFKQAKKQTFKQTRGNYPAPPKIIDAVKYGYKHGKTKGLENESKLFGELGATSESRALVNLFFSITDAKKNPLQNKVKHIDNVAVLGAGLMGTGIADVTINKAKKDVLLKDRDLKSASKGEKSIWKALDKKAKKKIISTFDRDRTAARVNGVDNYQAFSKVDLAIEAVFEDLDLKHKILAEVEEHTSENCIFATNTSSIPISEIAKTAKRPQNVIGMHYFSPVQKMPLLEIITTPKTADWVTATAYDIGVKQGKTVIVVKDGPGFYTTRILAPFINEALLLLEEGASIEFLDKALRDFGFPVGPITLLDEVGIDVGAHVAETMEPLFSKRGAKSSDKAGILLENNFLGRKNNKGFYNYNDGKKAGINTEIYNFFGGSKRNNPDKVTVQKRIVYMMVNEALHCFNEGIINSENDGNLGAIMGLGFPPFTGGPFGYLNTIGIVNFEKEMNNFAQKYGPRFKPAKNDAK